MYEYWNVYIVHMLARTLKLTRGPVCPKAWQGAKTTFMLMWIIFNKPDWPKTDSV